MKNLFFVLLSRLEFLGQLLVIECVERLFMARNVDQGLIFPQTREAGQAGYGKTRREIITLAENVCDKVMLRGSRVTSGWFRRFMERHPDLFLRKGDVTANVRMDCLNSETMKAYFDLLKDSPAQIYYIEASSQINQQILCGQTISKCIFTRVYSGLLQEPNVRNL